MSDVSRRAFGVSMLSSGGVAAFNRGGGPPRLVSYSPVPTASPTLQVLVVLGMRFEVGMTPSVSVSTPGMIAEAGVITGVTDTRFTWTVPLPTVGTIYLRVRNPDGKSSNALSVTVISASLPPIIVILPDEIFADPSAAAWTVHAGLIDG